MALRPIPVSPVRPTLAAHRWAGLLVAAVLVAYWPAFSAGFIWDDDAHVTPAALRSAGGLVRIWTEIGATQQFYPLLHSAFWLEHRLWGTSPLGYHLVNVGLHIIAALLLGLLLRRLAIPGALLAATLFALHPVHVESVAWISEQKNTLSAIFYLSAALAYLRFDEGRGRKAYVLALVLFVGGLLTKTVVATLPAALLVVIAWRRGRIRWRSDVVPLLPWFLLALVAGLLTAWIERRIIGAEGAAFELTALQRSLLAGRVGWFYLGKLAWPANLTFIYPRWEIDPAAWRDWLPGLAAIAGLRVLWRWRQRTRAPLAAALLFGGTLFPVLGFFNVYPFQYSFVADHFQYLASVSVIAFAVGSLVHAAHYAPIVTRRAAVVMAAAALMGFAALTRHQTHVYRDNRTLFAVTVARNPGAWMAWNNLGKEFMGAKPQLPAAIRCLERAIALRPDYPEALNNLGLALTQSGRAHDGLGHLERSLRLKPNWYQTHNNLGVALASLGRADEAVLSFQRAATLNPSLPNIHENWAKALVLLGCQAEADERFAIAARLRGR